MMLCVEIGRQYWEELELKVWLWWDEDRVNLGDPWPSHTQTWATTASHYQLGNDIIILPLYR